MRSRIDATTAVISTAASRSRASDHRRRTRTSPTIRAAKASVTTNAARQKFGAQPSRDAMASASSASMSRADRAATAARPVPSDARTRNVASIVRRFRLPGSAGVSSARSHDRLAGTGCEGGCAAGSAIATASRIRGRESMSTTRELPPLSPPGTADALRCAPLERGLVTLRPLALGRSTVASFRPTRAPRPSCCLRAPSRGSR